jgi:hypothetical protein
VRGGVVRKEVERTIGYTAVPMTISWLGEDSNDYLDGGFGIDTLSYSSSRGAHRQSGDKLATNSATGGHAFLHTISVSRT